MVEQEKLDNLMLELDGTENKCKQGLGWEEKESTETGRGCAGAQWVSGDLLLPCPKSLQRKGTTLDRKTES